MKQLAQITILFLFGISSFEIFLVAGTIVLLMQLLFTNISNGRKNYIIRAGKNRIQKDMWAIE